LISGLSELIIPFLANSPIVQLRTKLSLKKNNNQREAHQKRAIVRIWSHPKIQKNPEKPSKMAKISNYHLEIKGA
jgi:hypothetical protein